MGKKQVSVDSGRQVPSSFAGKAVLRLLAWYDDNGRDLPWRVRPGEKPDPYRVWLSEVMLQQTTVATVDPYYHTFIEHWPAVADLAAAELDDVLRVWQGLGYYARARNLHRCAVVVAGTLGGRFPEDEASLKTLPGIGDYTAAAVASIAFGKKASPVDGNVERVVARLFAVKTPLPASKKRLRELACGLTPEKRSGDFAQALMDLGATICTPRNPKCPECPLGKMCAALKQRIAADLPVRVPRRPRPRRFGVAFWVTNGDGAVLIRRREEKGLLGGMMEIPSTPWREDEWTKDEAIAAAPVMAGEMGGWRMLAKRVDHVFTHFELDLKVLMGRAATKRRVPAGMRWCEAAELGNQAFPSVMRKIIEVSING